MNMVDVFGTTSTTDEVLSGVNLQGQRILVTGVSAGLGLETARALAAHGADVVGAVRDLKKAEAATAQVRRDARLPAEVSSWLRLIWPVSKACVNVRMSCWRRGSSSTWLSPTRV